MHSHCSSGHPTICSTRILSLIMDNELFRNQTLCRSHSQHLHIHIHCMPRSPICTLVNLPTSPICTVIHTPIVHSYYSMKRLPLLLVRTVGMRYKFGFLVFPYDFHVKRYSELKIVLPKWRPNSSAAQNNVAHGGFARGKQRVKPSHKSHVR